MEIFFWILEGLLLLAALLVVLLGGALGAFLGYVQVGTWWAAVISGAVFLFLFYEIVSILMAPTKGGD